MVFEGAQLLLSHPQTGAARRLMPSTRPSDARQSDRCRSWQVSNSVQHLPAASATRATAHGEHPLRAPLTPRACHAAHRTRFHSKGKPAFRGGALNSQGSRRGIQRHNVRRLECQCP